MDVQRANVPLDIIVVGYVLFRPLEIKASVSNAEQSRYVHIELLNLALVEMGLPLTFVRHWRYGRGLDSGDARSPCDGP